MESKGILVVVIPSSNPKNVSKYEYRTACMNNIHARLKKEEKKGVEAGLYANELACDVYLLKADSLFFFADFDPEGSQLAALKERVQRLNPTLDVTVTTLPENEMSELDWYNDKERRVIVQDQGEWKGMMHCGEWVGTEEIPGSDGFCGPNTYFACQSCFRVLRETTKEGNLPKGLECDSLVRHYDWMQHCISETYLGPDLPLFTFVRGSVQKEMFTGAFEGSPVSISMVIGLCKGSPVAHLFKSFDGYVVIFPIDIFEGDEEYPIRCR
jgi:hypothetical protein